MLNEPRLLVCTDFSPSSDQALRLAQSLALKTNGQLILIHAAEVMFYMDWGAHLPEREDGKQKFSSLIHVDLLDKMHQQLERYKAKAKCEVVFSYDAAKSVFNLVKEEKINLVVIGGTGVNHSGHHSLGRLARKVAAQCPCPVLVARTDNLGEKVASLIDPESLDTAVKDWGRELALLGGQELEVLAVCENAWAFLSPGPVIDADRVLKALKQQSEEILSRHKDNLSGWVPKETKLTVLSANMKGTGRQIVDWLEAEHIQTAVLSRHKKSLVQRLFLGSVSSKVLELYQGNVLVC